MFKSKSESKDGILDYVLTGVLKISEAPSSPPIFNTDAEARAWAKEEAQRDYKAIDSRGNIYLLKNPLVWQYRKNADGTNTRIREKPKFEMSYKEALKYADQGKVYGKGEEEF